MLWVLFIGSEACHLESPYSHTVTKPLKTGNMMCNGCIGKENTNYIVVQEVFPSITSDAAG